jgi:hypothetical protein
MDTTVSVCAKNEKEAQEMVDVSTEQTIYMDTVGNRSQRGSVVDFNASFCPTLLFLPLARALLHEHLSI